MRAADHSDGEGRAYHKSDLPNGLIDSRSNPKTVRGQAMHGR
jgi:hypothetical protein